MVFMDNNTKAALDFQYVLNKIEVLTPYGLMFKNRMKPYIIGEEEELKYQLDILSAYIPFVEDLNIRRRFNNLLAHIKDLRNSIKRAVDGFTLNEVELFEIKNFLFLLIELRTLFEEKGIPQFEETTISPIHKLEKVLDPEDTKIATFYIYDQYSEELKEIRRNKANIKKEIRQELNRIKEKVEKELNINLKPDNSVMIPKNKKEDLVRLVENEDMVYVSETYMMVKFTIKPTEKINSLERQEQILDKKEDREEQRIKEMLTKEVAKRNKELYWNMLNIGRLDLFLAKAKFALDIRGTKPLIVNDHHIDIDNGRHPKVEAFLKERNLDFKPISVKLNPGVATITGANMGGKTISLKLIGLLAAMAQFGLYVPADRMTLGLSKYIKSSIGDMQSTDSGLSTFGGEIKVVKDAMERADEQGIILIDELARGTNPQEGYAISKAIVIHLLKKASITLLTTHYDNVADIEDVLHLQVVGLSNLDFDKLEEEIRTSDGMDIINKYMDYRLKVVEKSKEIPKDALNIARIMGLDKKILQIAEDIIDKERA